MKPWLEIQNQMTITMQHYIFQEKIDLNQAKDYGSGNC